MKEYIKNNKFNILIILIYSIGTLSLVFFHENWRDEAQSWLIARDLNFIDIIKQMKYEGHPCLWYLILFPFAKLGFPYMTENIISWLIMSITAWLLIKKSPFDNYIKILILMTSPFAYLFPVISRSYCLIPLAIILIAITYKNRKEEPVKYILSVVLLSFTHVIMLGLVIMLYIFFFFEELIKNFKRKKKQEKRKIIISFIIAISSLAFLFFQLFGCFQTNANVNSEITINANSLDIIINVIKTIIRILFGKEFFYIALPLLIILLLYEFFRYTKNALIISFSIGFQLLIYGYVYYASGQRAATILLIIILFIWIQKNETRNLKDKMSNISDILLSILLLINIIPTCLMIEKDIKYSYSGAKEIAEYINNNTKYENSIFIGSHMPLTSSIIPYTKTSNYWNPQVDRYFTYVIWDEKNENQNNIPIENILNNVKRKVEDNRNAYFIYCYNWKEDDLKYFIEQTNATELFKTRTDVIKSDEKYIIYKLYNN